MSPPGRVPPAAQPAYTLVDPARSRAGRHRRPRGGEPAGDAERARVAALVELAQGGDRESFAELYDRYLDTVYRYLVVRTGSPALAEDLTSETFLRALHGLGSFRWQGTDVGAWFLTIARNLVLDHAKSAAARREVSTADMLDAERGDGGIEDAVLGRLEARELLAAVRRLRPEHRDCLALRFLAGRSVAETAAAMGRSEGAVKQLQLRALQALARELPPAGEAAVPDGTRDGGGGRGSSPGRSTTQPVTGRHSLSLDRLRSGAQASGGARGRDGRGR